MKYMMLIYLNEKEWEALPAAKRDELVARGDRHFGALREKGKYVAGSPLHSVATATSIRASGGKLTVTDGPFAETREQLGGYVIFEAKDREEAIEITRALPAGDGPGTIELRALADFPQADAFGKTEGKPYMLLCYGNETAWEATPAEEKKRLTEDAFVFAAELSGKGKWVSGAPLTKSATAVSVRSKGGKVLLTDGPFAETREQLGGYVLFNAKDLDDAIGVGKRFHAMRAGTVEVRPVADGSNCSS